MSYVSTAHRESDARLPPQALEAEQSVLGGLLLDTRRWEDISDLITPEDFYNRHHRSIFAAIRELYEKDVPVDVVTASEWLQEKGKLDEVGGLAYLGQLAKNTPNTANLLSYARIVAERALLRRLIETANTIVAGAYQPQGASPGEIVEIAESLIFELGQNNRRRDMGFVAIRGLLDRSDRPHRAALRVQCGVDRGFHRFQDLDTMTSGLQRSDLVIVAGRPSMGKTSPATNMAENVAVGAKLPVAVFSMEMPGQQLAMRMLASLGRINAHKVRTGRLSRDDWPRLTSAVELLNEARIFIDDTPALNPLELRSRARRLMREHGQLGLIVVDYLQLMQAASNQENRAIEVSNITRGLKIMAKELDVPVMVLSQLNRSLEQRPNKRPVMSDLRESGAIEQDADVILFIYRDEVYNEDSTDKGVAEIIIGKQRNGPTGTVRLTFFGEFTRFENFASGDYAGDFQ
ncbi:MAG: replicative DNA helicase [Gammaproteobacteria bacterium]|nr:replicative DNA helicase [Gammaproteobacteria bacterium]